MHDHLKIGLEWLSNLSNLPPKMEYNKQSLLQIREKLSSAEDVLSWLSVVQALIAVSHHTFGVGAVIVDKQRNLIAAGGNQVFHPYFRSDLHAEMNVLNQLEDLRQLKEPATEYTLYTSLQPCMMCLGRIIFSRIGHTYYVTVDPHGGVIADKHLPYTLADLKRQQIIKEANCMASLKEISASIIAFSVQQHVDNLGGKVNVLTT